MLVSSFSVSVARPTSPRMRSTPRVLQSPASCEAAPEGYAALVTGQYASKKCPCGKTSCQVIANSGGGVPGPATSPLATPLACGRGTATSPLATPLACGRGRGIDPFAPSLLRSDGRLPLHIPPGLPIPCPVIVLVGAPIGHGRRKRGPAGETQLNCSRQRLAVGCSTWKKRFKIPEGGGWRPLRKRREIPEGWLKVPEGRLKIHEGAPQD